MAALGTAASEVTLGWLMLVKRKVVTLLPLLGITVLMHRPPAAVNESMLDSDRHRISVTDLCLWYGRPRYVHAERLHNNHGSARIEINGHTLNRCTEFHFVGDAAPRESPA